jgi:hypothetical protein
LASAAACAAQAANANTAIAVRNPIILRTPATACILIASPADFNEFLLTRPGVGVHNTGEGRSAHRAPAISYRDIP